MGGKSNTVEMLDGGLGNACRVVALVNLLRGIERSECDNLADKMLTR